MGGNTDMDGSLLRAGMQLGRGALRAQGGDGGDAAEAAVVLARSRASQEREAGRQEAAQVQDQVRQRKARRLSSHGASGLTLSGSPLLAAAAEGAQGEEAVQTALDQGQERAADALAQGQARAASLRRRSDSLLSRGGSLWDLWQD